jgi:hypothetical protein
MYEEEPDIPKYPVNRGNPVHPGEMALYHPQSLPHLPVNTVYALQVSRWNTIGTRERNRVPIVFQLFTQEAYPAGTG